MSKHFKTFSSAEYRNHFASGLTYAIGQVEGAEKSLPLEQRQALVKPLLDAEDYDRCENALRIVDAFATLADRKVTLDEVLVYQLQGMLQKMDPHSTYHPGEEWLKIKTAKNAASPGIFLARDGKLPRVARVYDEGPADGVLSTGDRIVRVTNMDTGATLDCGGQPLETVRTFLRGAPGERFRIDLQRQGVLRNVTLTLAAFAGRRVGKGDVLSGNVAYLQVMDFSRGTAHQFSEVVRGLLQKGARSLIIDLRYNPGGSVDEAVAMMDVLLDVGVGTAFQDRFARVSKLRMSDAGLLSELPIAVLVNRFSASAAEMVAGGLHDYERAVQIGEVTFGKGTAQMVYPPISLQYLVDPSVAGALRLTEYQYFTPAGHSPQRDGVKPHIEVVDVQLTKRVEEMRRKYRERGEPLITAEREYLHALPALSLKALFETSERPTNRISGIIENLARTKVVVDQPVFSGDLQLAQAWSLMQRYQEECLSFHASQCNFSGETEGRLWHVPPHGFSADLL